MDLIETRFAGRQVRMDPATRTFTEADETGTYGEPQPFEPDMARTIDEHEALVASAATRNAQEVALTRALATLRTFVAMDQADRPAYFAANYPDVRGTMAAYLAVPVPDRTERARELYGLVQANVLEITTTMAMGGP